MVKVKPMTGFRSECMPSYQTKYEPTMSMLTGEYLIQPQCLKVIRENGIFELPFWYEYRFHGFLFKEDSLFGQFI